MIKKIFLFAVFALALASCKSKKDAYNYNQQIVAMENELEPAITSTEDKVGKYIDAQQFDSVVVAGEAMEKKVQQKIDILDGKPAPSAKEGASFKAAVLKYFKYIKSLYASYTRLGKAKDQAGRETVFKEMQDIVGDKGKIIMELQAVQKKFASANGFRIE